MRVFVCIQSIFCLSQPGRLHAYRLACHMSKVTAVEQTVGTASQHHHPPSPTWSFSSNQRGSQQSKTPLNTPPHHPPPPPPTPPPPPPPPTPPPPPPPRPRPPPPPSPHPPPLSGGGGGGGGRGGGHLEKAIEVVEVPVLPAPMMHCVLGHGLLWAPEHRGLVHVVPHKQGGCGALGRRQTQVVRISRYLVSWHVPEVLCSAVLTHRVLVQAELSGVPGTSGGVVVVQVAGLTWGGGRRTKQN